MAFVMMEPLGAAPQCPTGITGGLRFGNALESFAQFLGACVPCSHPSLDGLQSAHHVSVEPDTLGFGCKLLHYPASCVILAKWW